MADYRDWTTADLEAEHVALNTQREALRAACKAIHDELERRADEARLRRLAEGFTPEQLAAMVAMRQEIRPAGIASGEAVGTPGAR